jgi:carboxymethylenebutenolidase
MAESAGWGEVPRPAEVAQPAVAVAAPSWLSDARIGLRREGATVGEMVSFSSNGGTTDAYLALPAAGTGPGVIVVQEWWGLVGHIKNVVDRFAAAGFVALAPDFFHGAKTDEPDEAMRLLMGLAMDQAAKDIAGAAQYLHSRDEQIGKVGAVGYCMGGSLSLWSGALTDEVVVSVNHYPAIPWERMGVNWGRYAGKHAVFHCSEEDGTSQADGIQAAKAAIEAAGGTVTLYDYPGSKHAFFNDERPEVHDAGHSADAWDRTLAALRAQLG